MGHKTKLVKNKTKGLLNEARYWQTFWVKGQIVNILGFVGHVVLGATTQLLPVVYTL